MRKALSPAIPLFLAGVIMMLVSWPRPALSSDPRLLGIGEDFGRWQGGTVSWQYKHSGAPAIFGTSNDVLAMIQEAIDEIEGVAGVHFEFQGVNNGAVIGDTSDNVVTMGWEDIGGAAGLAGPATVGCTAQDKIDVGYCAYTDGTVRFNNNAGANWDLGDPDFNQRNFVQVATHEFLHLLGIGHSEQQQSIMFADPYSDLNHVRDDDIDALQSLYGSPDDFSPPSIYIPPGAGASPLEDSFISGSNNPFTVEITMIDGSETDVFAGLFWQVPDGHTDDLFLVATDPIGYFYSGTVDDRDCSTGPGGSCLFWKSFASMDSLFTFPGVWTVYGIMNGAVVTTKTVTVTTSPVFNATPDSYIVKSPIRGQAPLTVDLSLVVTGDSEGDAVDATWHIPTVGEIALDSGNFPASAGTTTQSVTFDTPGDYEIYIEVNDSWVRYGVPQQGNEAGNGFRTLYRIVVQALKRSDDITAVSDVTGDSIPDIVAFTGTDTAKPRIKVYSGSDGGLLKKITYNNVDRRGVALATIRDANQNGTPNDPAVALLSDNDNSGVIAVETRRVSNKASLGTIKFLSSSWRAIDVAVIDDMNADGVTNDSAIAVLAQKISNGKIKVQVRSFPDGALISNKTYLNSSWTPVALAVADRSAMSPAGTLLPLIGVLAEKPKNGENRVQARLAGTGAFDRNIKFFDSLWDVHDVSVNHDANGNGNANDPVWQVLATRRSDNMNRVQSRYVVSGSFDKSRDVLNSKWQTIRLDAIADINGNSANEMAVSAAKRSNGNRRIQIRDYATNKQILTFQP